MNPYNMILHNMDTLKLLMHEKNINYVEKGKKRKKIVKNVEQVLHS